LKKEISKPERKYLTKIYKKLKELGILNNPEIYDIPIRRLFETEIREEEELKKSYPEYYGLVELSSKHKKKEDKFWKWQTKIQNKVYYALLEEFEHQKESVQQNRLHVLTNSPDHELALEEELKKANNSYTQWFSKKFSFSRSDSGYFKLKVIERVLTWTNYYPVEFWKYAKNENHHAIQIEIRHNFGNNKPDEYENILEGIEQLVNFDFVTEQNSPNDPKNLKTSTKQKSSNSLHGNQETLIIYYLVQYEKKHSELKGLSSSEKAKDIMEQYQNKYKIAFTKKGKALTGASFRNYYCDFKDLKTRISYLTSDVLERLQNYPNAYKQALKEFERK